MVNTQAPQSLCLRRPLRVLLWCPWGAGLHYSGPGMSAYRLYSAAAKGDFELTLVHGVSGHRHYDLYQRQIQLPAIGPSPWHQFRFMYHSRRWLATHASQFDVFHGIWGYEATVAAAVYAADSGLPAVVKVAAHRADLSDKGGWRDLLGTARRRREKLHRIDAVIAISRAIYDELLEYGLPPEKVVQIPNGVDTSVFRPVASPQERSTIRQRLDLPDRPTLLFVGGLESRKRPHLLIESLADLRARHMDCQLVLAGPSKSATYEAELRAIARQRKVEDSVIWLGMYQDVATLYRAADLFLLPSQNEGMPNALLEAMSSGLPSIVTPISGSLDLIDHAQQGMIADPTVDAITDAAAAYLESPALCRQHGDLARQRIEDKYSAHVVLQAHQQLFERIVGGKPANATA